MTDEEAIKRLKNKLENDIEYANRCNPFSDLVHEVILDNKAVERVLNLIENKDKRIKELEKALDERFMYVTGARTVYARLMSLDKEIIVRDDLKLRNEIEQNIKDEEKLKLELEKKEKTIENMAEWIFDKDYTENSLLIHRDDYYSNYIKQVIEYFEKKEG